jgi:hypothetical protein
MKLVMDPGGDLWTLANESLTLQSNHMRFKVRAGSLWFQVTHLFK